MKILDFYTEDITALIIRYLKGECQEDETRMLISWVKADPAHQQVFDEISDIWTAAVSLNHVKFDSLQALKKVRVKTSVTPHVRKGKIKSLELPPFYRIFKVAAIFIFIVLLGGITFYGIRSSGLLAPGAGFITEISAPMGSKSHVVLPDGTKIWLNAGSSLKYNTNFSGKKREVELEGEAYFDVVKKEGQPFFVKTNDIIIKVLGTAFNVKAYPNEGAVETTLVRGSLIVEQNRRGKENIRAVLEPNQRATFIKSQGKLFLTDTESATLKMEKIKKLDQIKGKILLTKKIDTEPFTAWKDNRLVFRNEPFESLAVKLERWYGVKITIQGNEIRNFHFNGTIENETVQDVLKIIKYALPINYVIKHNVITISLDKRIMDNGTSLSKPDSL